MNLLQYRLFALVVVALLYGCATTQHTGGAASAVTSDPVPGVASDSAVPDPGSSAADSSLLAAANRDHPEPEVPPALPRADRLQVEDPAEPQQPEAVPPQRPEPKAEPQTEPEPEPRSEPQPQPAPKLPAPGIYLEVPKGSAPVASGQRVNVRFVNVPGRRMQLEGLRMLVDGKDLTPTLRMLARITATGLKGIPVSSDMGLGPGKRRLQISVWDSLGDLHRLETEVVVRR